MQQRRTVERRARKANVKPELPSLPPLPPIATLTSLKISPKMLQLNQKIANDNTVQACLTHFQTQLLSEDLVAEDELAARLNAINPDIPRIILHSLSLQIRDRWFNAYRFLAVDIMTHGFGILRLVPVSSQSISVVATSLNCGFSRQLAGQPGMSNITYMTAPTSKQEEEDDEDEMDDHGAAEDVVLGMQKKKNKHDIFYLGDWDLIRIPPTAVTVTFQPDWINGNYEWSVTDPRLNQVIADCMIVFDDKAFCPNELSLLRSSDDDGMFEYVPKSMVNASGPSVVLWNRVLDAASKVVMNQAVRNIVATIPEKGRRDKVRLGDAMGAPDDTSAEIAFAEQYESGRAENAMEREATMVSIEHLQAQIYDKRNKASMPDKRTYSNVINLQEAQVPLAATTPILTLPKGQAVNVIPSENTANGIDIANALRGEITMGMKNNPKILFGYDGPEMTDLGHKLMFQFQDENASHLQNILTNSMYVLINKNLSKFVRDTGKGVRTAGFVRLSVNKKTRTMTSNLKDAFDQGMLDSESYDAYYMNDLGLTRKNPKFQPKPIPAVDKLKLENEILLKQLELMDANIAKVKSDMIVGQQSLQLQKKQATMQTKPTKKGQRDEESDEMERKQKRKKPTSSEDEDSESDEDEELTKEEKAKKKMSKSSIGKDAKPISTEKEEENKSKKQKKKEELKPTKL